MPFAPLLIIPTRCSVEALNLPQAAGIITRHRAGVSGEHQRSSHMDQRSDGLVILQLECDVDYVVALHIPGLPNIEPKYSFSQR
jgi:hypothetical protein